MNQENLVKKIYFPRIVLPIAYVTSMLINMLLTFIVIFAVLLISGYGINIRAVCVLPLVILIEYVLALGLCMLTSALAVYFRDLEYILGIITYGWMYLTPILYTVDMVPEEFRTLFGIKSYDACLYWGISRFYIINRYRMLKHFCRQRSRYIGLIVGYIVFEKNSEEICRGVVKYAGRKRNRGKKT